MPSLPKFFNKKGISWVPTSFSKTSLPRGAFQPCLQGPGGKVCQVPRWDQRRVHALRAAGSSPRFPEKKNLAIFFFFGVFSHDLWETIWNLFERNVLFMAWQKNSLSPHIFSHWESPKDLSWKHTIMKCPNITHRAAIRDLTVCAKCQHRVFTFSLSPLSLLLPHPHIFSCICLANHQSPLNF